MKNRLPAVKRFLGAGIVFAAGLVILLTACSYRSSYAGPVATVSIGTTTSEVNSLILIAQDRGYFASNGLNIVHKIYPSGAAALDGMLNKEVDLATGSEFAFAGQVLAGQDIQTIGAINRSSIEYLVGRLDRGIGTIADLKGKRIGVPLGSRPEFALDRFLYFRSVDISEVTVVDVPVNQSVEALVGGVVDAVVAWQPYIDRIQEQMNGEVVVWSVQEDQPSYTLLMCTSKWADDNGPVVTRLLKSLVQAESYVADHPDEARAFVQEKQKYDAPYMASVWPDYRFSVSLDQALIAAMEDQARWIIARGLATEKDTPNFVKYIYLDGLEAAKPAAVTVIR